MGSGDKNPLNFHLHIPYLHHHHGKKEMRDIPRGCLAIMVGQGEEQQRFIIPVIYINHPLFMQLLKEAEEEYGFDQKGPINIPCHVEVFRYVQGMIDKDKSQHHHHHHHHVWCFKEFKAEGARATAAVQLRVQMEENRVLSQQVGQFQQRLQQFGIPFSDTLGGSGAGCGGGGGEGTSGGRGRGGGSGGHGGTGGGSGTESEEEPLRRTTRQTRGRGRGHG